MKYLTIILVLILFSRCSNDIINNEIQFSDFKKTINLNYADGVEINTGNIFGRTSWLYRYDSIIIAHDPYKGNKGIHIFINKKYITSFGNIGEGANEISRPGPISIDQNGRYLWVADFGRLSYTRYNLKSIMEQKDEIQLRKFNFKKNASFEFVPISDSSLLCMTMEPPFLYEILSEQGEMKIAEINKILKHNKKLSFEHCMTTFAYEPNSKSIFLAFRYLDALMKLDKDGNVLFMKKFFDKIGFDKPVDEVSGKEISTFSFLKIIDSKLFVLYTGSEIFRTGEVGQPVANNPDKLLIFDLDGNPLTLIKFDSEIFDYVYDPLNKELIVYSFNSELYPLISYHLDL